MSTQFTEKLVQRRSDQVEKSMRSASKELPGVSQSALVANSSNPGSWVKQSIENTGTRFQEVLRTNPMDHVNRNLKSLVAFAQRVYEQKGEQFEFGVLLLAQDPAEYDSQRSLEGKSFQSAPKTFFGRARAIKVPVGQDRFVYTLKVQVVGARMSELMQTDEQGHRLSTAVSSRELMRSAAAQTLTEKCGTRLGIIGDISDVSHMSLLLPAVDDANSGGRKGIIHAVLNSKGHHDVQESDVMKLTHTHGVTQPQAERVSNLAVVRSTALNPLTESQTGEDTFVVKLDGTDKLTIIPIWSEINGQSTFSIQQANEAKAASMILGAATTFGEAGVNQIATQVVEQANRGNPLPLSRLKIQRQNG